ncbi:hypothetical protein N7533_010761 [Penicillium manginii]|uniref:uncharacterized protein n=1 Tax=Penicillium manginii TaxID=203109 RepID=UPI002548827E|nr:uncharacterized protein N7533_010761 [Penicillium manginii]KAJ5741352.1 hypothetical protein N7533_010761 [Penicillium manginii]
MDDLNGLSWSSNSNAPTNKPPPMGSGFMFPNVRSNGASGRSTPMSAASNRSNSPAKPAASTGDSFANLVSFNSSSNNKNLSLLEQQKRMQEEKAKQEAEKRSRYEAQYGGPEHAKEEDILAAFNAAAPVDASTNFPIPRSASSSRLDVSSRQGTPSAGITMQDNTSGLDAFDDDDDPFGLNQLKPKPAPAPLATQDDDDDFLGLLGKPVSEIPRQPSPQERTPSFNNGRGQGSSPMPSSDEDRAIAELVDMGFPADKSRQALRTTQSGTDVQGAVSYLLTSAHAEARQKTQGRAASNGPADGRGDRSQSRNRDGPSWMREGRSQTPQSREDSRSPGAAEKDPAQIASQFGNNLLKTAGSFWKAGSKKFQQAVNEFNTEHDSSQPKWMRDASSTQEEPLPPRPPRRGETGQPQSGDPNMTDEAMLLEGGNSGPPRKPTRPTAPGGNELRQPSPSQHLQQPNFLQRPSRPSSAEPRSRASRFAAEEQSAHAYPKPASPAPPRNGRRRSQYALRQHLGLYRHSHHKLFSPPTVIARRLPRHGSGGDFAAAHESYSTALGMLPEKHPITIIIRSNRAMTGLRIGEPKAVIEDAETMLAVIGPSKGEAETIDLGNGDSPKPMKDFFGKALMRKAEALEHLERWADAAQTWKLAVESGHGGSTSIQGRNRCEKASGISKAPPKPAAPAKKRPTPAPKKPSALSDLSGSSGTGQDSAAVSRLREANKAAEREDDEKFALSESVDLKIANWKNGKQDNLRALLGSLDTVLWAESGWKKISLAELVLPNKVKIQYMKGIAKVHPDKISTTATTEQRMISSAVFGILNEAWDKFRVENNL